MVTELERLRGENVVLLNALKRIKCDYGQVCENFETCSHTACTSSYSAWATADFALASSELSALYAAVVSEAEALRVAWEVVDLDGRRSHYFALCDAVDALRKARGGVRDDTGTDG